MGKLSISKRRGAQRTVTELQGEIEKLRAELVSTAVAALKAETELKDLREAIDRGEFDRLY